MVPGRWRQFFWPLVFSPPYSESLSVGTKVLSWPSSRLFIELMAAFLTAAAAASLSVLGYALYRAYETTKNRRQPSNKPEPDPKVVLTVKSVDLKVGANGTAHRTNKFDISSPNKPSPKLVIRRGQPFVISIDFSKAYDAQKDDLRLVFEVGSRPLTSKGTRVEFILSDVDKPKEWGAKIIKQEGTTLTINVFTPPNCLVAAWDFKVDVVQRADTNVQVYRYEHEDPIYILFNPWCKDDGVYLSDEKLLSEYILNETGKIYSGSKSNITSKPWNFGQFESCVLDCALYLLDVSELSWGVRGNPIPVVRKLSAMINSSDDGGILTGNWTGDYSGGRSPLSWTGSVPILEEYWRTKRPVKFGQCWVFSGITTTICRALGIPARSVTNFASAHDTDGSISIDVHFRPDGEVDEHLNYDSIWNFHVWNEVWMARPDLPKGFGGWQAIDATPQEASDGVYCCGPTSVHAIQQGEVNLPFDGPFLFAEVNADRVYWMPDATGKLECVYYDKKVVGKYISTKAPNSHFREDVTEHYKHNEGSSEERAAVLKANQVGSSKQGLYKTKTADVKFTVEQDSKNTWLGGSFVVGLRIANNSKESRTVSGRIAVRTMYYTGVLADKLKSEPFEVVVKPSTDTVHQVTVTQDEYDGKLKDCCMMDVSIWGHVKETDQNYTVKEDYRLRKPHLTAKTPPQVVAGKEFKVDVSFTNPLNTTLTNCFVAVNGLSQEYKFKQGNVAPGATFVASLPIVPEKIGETELIVVFNSAQLEDVNVAVPVVVKSA